MTASRYEVFFEPDAQAEALSAARYIALDSPRNASRWYKGLERAIESLALFPHRCAIAPESKYLGRELRHYIYKSHRVIFEIDENEAIVRILHVRHGAMRAIGEVGDLPT